MPEETVYESIQARNREAIAAYLRRMADAFDSTDAVHLGESTAVDPPVDAELEVEVEREDDETSLEFEIEWEAREGDVDTDADAVLRSESGADEAGGSESGADAASGSGTDADAGSAATFELYQDRADEWRWRLRHANGNVIADGGEGYSKKANAVNGIDSVKSNAAGAVVEEQD